ncbi:MAG: ABC transporter ATP-binding protein [Pseudomonadota bacterium]
MTMTALAQPFEETASSAPLSLEDIRYEVGNQPILKSVSLEVRPREIVCLLGPSGCGKTTLLRIAAGIARQSSGVVRVSGEVVADATRFEPAETRPLGLVFQDLALFPHMRVVDNVAYGLRGMRGAREEAAAKLKGFGLEGYERAYPHQLSGGEQQRVALARALLPAPKVVLFDEPFSGLDRSLRDTVREDTLSLLKGREATAVIVTHDPEEALAMADRIALMREGRIVQTGTPEEIWRAPVDLEAAKIFCHVNTFTGRVHDGVVTTAIGAIPVGPEREGEDLTVAFRPEALNVVSQEGEAGAELVVEHRRFLGTHVELAGRVGTAQVVVRADPYLVPRQECVRIVPDLRQTIILPGEQ